MTSKVQPAADYWTVDGEDLRGWGCVIFSEQKNKELIFFFKTYNLFWIYSN